MAEQKTVFNLRLEPGLADQLKLEARAAGSQSMHEYLCELINRRASARAAIMAEAQARLEALSKPKPDSVKPRATPRVKTIAADGMKYCADCKQTKPLAEFWHNGNRPRPRCAQCEKLRRAAGKAKAK